MNDCESCIHYPPSAADGKPAEQNVRFRYRVGCAVSYNIGFPAYSKKRNVYMRAGNRNENNETPN